MKITVNENQETYPLIKIFDFNEGESCFLYDARVNTILSLSLEEKEIVLSHMKIGHFECKATKKEEFVKKLNCSGFLIKGNAIQIKEPTFLNIDKIMEEAKFNAIPKKLVLELTNNCNLRCTYCGYTINEKKKQGKSHGSNVLSLKNAKRAISNYLLEYTLLIDKLQDHNDLLTHNPPNISFYGGEALIVFGLLKEIVNYIKEICKNYDKIKYDDILISLTTNGTLITSEIADFLIKENIYVSISLDGPPIENDKNRVFRNGKGTGKIVENVIELLKKKSINYYKNRVKIQAVVAPNYNHEVVGDYFFQKSTDGKFSGANLFEYLEYTDFSPSKNNDEHKVNSNISDNSFIDYINTFDYKSLTDEDLLEKLTFYPAFNNRLTKIFEFYNRLSNNPSIEIKKFNTCYIGKTQLFVDCQSNFHLCERSDFSMPIGSIENGKDVSKIRKMYAEYLEVMNSTKCKNCWVFNFCPICIGMLIKEGRITTPSNDTCVDITNFTSVVLKDLLIIITFYPRIFELMMKSYNTNDKLFIEYNNKDIAQTQ